MSDADPPRRHPGPEPSPRPRPVRSEADRTGRVVAVGQDRVTYQTLAGEDAVGWADLRSAAEQYPTVSVRHFWARVLAEAAEAARRNGQARVAVRDLGGPGGHPDAPAWAAVAETMDGERLRDSAADAALFAAGSRAAASANADELHEAMARLGYEVVGPR